MYLLIFYYRLHNGEILDSPPLIDFNNINCSKSLVSVESAIQKANEKLSTIEDFKLVRQYKPVVVQDLIGIFSCQTQLSTKSNISIDLSSSKINVIEGVFRLYDLIYYIEWDLKDPK